MPGTSETLKSQPRGVGEQRVIELVLGRVLQLVVDSVERVRGHLHRSSAD